MRARLTGNSPATLRQSGERREETKKSNSEGPRRKHQKKRNDLQKEVPAVWVALEGSGPPLSLLRDRDQKKTRNKEVTDKQVKTWTQGMSWLGGERAVAAVTAALWKGRTRIKRERDVKQAQKKECKCLKERNQMQRVVFRKELDASSSN